MRLDKAVTLTGCTRAQAKKAIGAGRVLANGVVCRDAAMQVSPERVALDGVCVGVPGHTHLMLYKPSGVITASRDRARTTVFDLLDEEYRARDLAAVGRLDVDTTGLLLFTTDGVLAHRLISPKWTVEKVYVATVDGLLVPAHVQRMLDGIRLTDFTAKPARLTILAENTARIVVTEGKYHQVRRMFGALGLPVISLHRERVGNVVLDPALGQGKARLLTPEEARGLYEITKLEDA